ncbi:GH3 auxin-responsive promoter family protein [Limibacter armeniacum]|uniref:GH3 auxin-responsive promoter family protein n=1 Tax=Limibacter armeniacum TaxID=466084 RepID=UPI002FE5C11C
MAIHLFNSAVNWMLKRRMEEVEYFMQNPLEVQERTFQQLIKSAKDTEWGRKYNYRNIRNGEDFKRDVPVSTYEELYPYIERLMQGEQNLLWPTKINCFSKSSGTTNARSKFIPVSGEALEETHYKAGKAMFAIYVNRYPETKFSIGKSLGIGGSYQQNHLNDETYYGDVSALIMKNLPFWAELMRAPSIEIALMDEWESKIEKIARTTINENITSLAGVPTWTLVLLQRILDITGKNSIAEVWPGLEVFFHGAVAFGPYRDSFQKLIQHPDMHYMEVYNASEGYFGIQDTNVADEMLLLLDYGVYYEFIPMDEWGKENPKVIDLGDVEVGKNYAMIISTNAGLWRYHIGDTVRFTSTSPYRIKITGRTKHFINAFGEELVIENAEEAITAACQVTGALVNNFSAAPIYLEAGKQGGHEWVVEFEHSPENMDIFVNVLDSKLREINSDYDAKRYKDIALIKPIIHNAPKGTFYEWMKRKGKLGGQHKVPRLANNREHIDSLIEVMNSVKI